MAKDEGKAFACVVTGKEVWWKRGEDSFNRILGLKFGTAQKFEEEFVQGELVRIVPKNGDYLFPDEWQMIVGDGKELPPWWNEKCKVLAFKAFNEWQQWLYSRMDASKFPKNPFNTKAVVDEDIEYLTKWTLDRVNSSSVKDVSMRIKNCFGYSLWNSIDEKASVLVKSITTSIQGIVENQGFPGSSLWDFIKDAAKDIVYLQIGNMFSIDLNDYCSSKKEEYRFKFMSKFLERGLVPVQYHGYWHLFGSPNGDGKVELLYTEK